MVSGYPDVSNSFVAPPSMILLSPVWVVVSGPPLSHLSCHVVAHLSPSLAGCARCLSVSPSSNSCVSQSGTRLSRGFQFICLWNLALHAPAGLAGGVRLFGCLQSMRLPVCLVVPESPDASGLPDISNPFLSKSGNSFVCQFGWWCPGLRDVFNSFASHFDLTVPSSSFRYFDLFAFHPRQ